MARSQPHIQPAVMWREEGVWCLGVSRLVNGVDDHGIVTRRDGDKGEGPSHQLVVVLQNEVLGTHLQHCDVGVLEETSL